MLQEAEVSVLLQEKSLGQEEQLPANLAAELLLVSGRKKKKKKKTNLVGDIRTDLPRHEACQQSLASSAFSSGIYLYKPEKLSEHSLI